MFNRKNTYHGASFDYEEGASHASGDYRFDGENITSVNIQGSIVKDDVTYAFSARVNNIGVISIDGITDIDVMPDCAAEAKRILLEILNDDNAE